MDEQLHTAEWIVSKLEGDTGSGGLFDPARTFKPSGAYLDLIPAGRPLPAVRFSAQDSSDTRGAGDKTRRILTRIDWLIVLVEEGNNIARLLPLVDRLDTVLNGANGSTPAVIVDSCVRLSPFTLLEPVESGVTYRHAGGLYRTLVYPT